MTLVVGFVGLDGAVMASDSEVTARDRTRFEEPKIWKCHGLLMGYSGHTAVETPLARAIDDSIAASEPSGRIDVVKCIQAAALPVLEHIYSTFLPRPPQGQIPAEIAGHLLVAGHDPEGYWLGVLDESVMFDFATRGFVAIGSGSVAAQVANGLLSRYELAGRAIEDLKLVAYRTVAACIAVLGRGYGIGGSIKMWVSRAGAPFRELSEIEVDHLGHGVEQWIGVEKDSLTVMSRKREEWETESGILIARELPPDLESGG